MRKTETLTAYLDWSLSSEAGTLLELIKYIKVSNKTLLNLKTNSYLYIMQQSVGLFVDPITVDSATFFSLIV